MPAAGVATSSQQVQQKQQDAEQQEPLLADKRRFLHPLDWGFLACCLAVVAGTLLAAVLIMSASAANGHNSSLPAPNVSRVADVWPDSARDLTAVSWAHAVNSRADLQKALKDDSVMMLEADVSMGRVAGSDRNSSSASVPIMAHPPHITSDLSLGQFVEMVAKAVKEKSLKKGIKLDFKDIGAMEASMKILEEARTELTFPVWLNADVLSGPGAASHPSGRDPVDPDRFLSLCSGREPGRTLSLGWTTLSARLQAEKGPAYTKESLDQMAKLLEQHPPGSSSVTFAVRASMALKTKDGLLPSLLRSAGPSSTLTVWSAEGDDVSGADLAAFVEKVGRKRVYVDVPAPLKQEMADSFEKK